ncbi:MAG: hypothetical protein O3A13_16520 [Proteobacteria bacterium]|nr:hypothetical protein [Pseudomonadota bacterium]
MRLAATPVYSYMTILNRYPPDHRIPVKRLQLDRESGVLAESPAKPLFLRGPIPMAWLEKAAELPGKTINVALALWWLHGMNDGKAFKLTGKALAYLHVSRDATYNGLERLEKIGLIQVERKPGSRPTISILQHEMPDKKKRGPLKRH